MSDMWRTRAPPTPLDFDAIMDGSFNQSTSAIKGPNVTSTNGATSSSTLNGIASSSSSKTRSTIATESTRRQPSRRAKTQTAVSTTNVKANGVKGKRDRKGKGVQKTNGHESSHGEATGPAAGLKDQRKLSLKDNVELFVSR